MTKAFSIRLPDDLAQRIEADAERQGVSLNTQVVAMLENGKANTDDLMLSARIPRDTMVKSIEYHASDELGLDAVLNTNEDVEHWSKYIIREVGGVDGEVGVTATDETVTVTGGVEVIEAVRSYII